jgi:hypothetical protein
MTNGKRVGFGSRNVVSRRLIKYKTSRRMMQDNKLAQNASGAEFSAFKLFGGML